MIEQTYIIEDAEIDHIEEIRDIYAHYVLNTTSNLDEIVPSLDELQEIYESVVDKGLPYVVAKLPDETIIGFAYAAPYRKRLAYRFTVENSIYVHKDHLNKGVAQALMNEVINHCKLDGYKQMVAVIVGVDNVPSINFHKKLGFTERGHLEKVGFKFGKWLDTLLFQKEL
jgi:L-amino acid N-acyltransferase YncA